MWSGEFGRGLVSRWSGVYRYDPQVGVDLPGQTTFAMQLSHGSLGGFLGTIDDGDGGIPEPASVTGRIFLRSMRFAKRYPHLWVPSTEDSSGPLEVLAGVAPAPVRYVGRLSADGCAVEGRWAISPIAFPLDGQWMQIGSVSGTWSAERIDLRSEPKAV